MEIYLVGGAVRDKLLGLGQADRDWVVTGATPRQMEEAGYQAVGQDFPVFLHPRTHEEYALARTERKTAPGYKGFVFNADSSVTLEEDLLRRDLTINAMAEDEQGRLIDPYGGHEDIRRRILRHVSPAFVEDPLRVLRVARFAARFAGLGFRVADETLQLMREIGDNGELAHLVAERAWREIHRALEEDSPVVFIEVLRRCDALRHILPEVDNLFGVPQPATWHPEVDTGKHSLMCLEQASRLSREPVVRFATLVHDVGKGTTPREDWPHHYGHEKRGERMIKDMCARLRAPKAFTQLACLASRYHTHCHQAARLRPSTLLRLLEGIDAMRRPERMEQFLRVCEADARGRTGFEDRPYPQRRILQQALAAVHSVDSRQVVENMREDRRRDGDAIRQAIRQQRIGAIRKALQEQEPA